MGSGTSLREDVHHFLSGGGEMGERIRSFDWSATPLGPIERWPQSLKTAVRIMLGSRYQMFVWWGEELINLYNDAYASVLGRRHPSALGQPAEQLWHEIWHVVGPETRTVLRENRATWNDRVQLLMERNDYVEETYVTWSYSPLPDDAGDVGGVFCVCYEDTDRVLGERRLAALQQLADATAGAQSAEEACVLAAGSLEQHPEDISFALVYLLEGDGGGARLAATAGLPAGPGVDAAFWPWERALGGERLKLTDLGPAALPGGAWPEPTHTAMVLPLDQGALERPSGFVVLGASPRLAFDERYQSFVELVGAGIASAIVKARALQEERRRQAALAEIDRAKTVFFSNVSHEFRTPLTLMLGPLEDALAESLAPEQRTRLELLQRNALRLQKLVNTLLDFSRLEAGRMQASYEPTDLAALTAELASVFRSAIERAGMRLIVDCPPQDAPVYVDRDMVEKIVLNLLSNAFKFTQEGEIAITLRDAGDAVELAVADTGIGIAEEHLPRLFERFHRIPGVQARTHEGTGIGLALVHGLAKLHGGAVAVRSAPGQGSTFTVSFPKGKAHLPGERIAAPRELESTALAPDHFLEEAVRWLPEGIAPSLDDSRARAALADARPAGADDGGPRARIVWADDNADMRDYVRRLLAPLYEVEAVADGEAALAAVRREPPELLLADVMMPRLDGFGLLRAMRADPQTRAIPVILLSARAREESRLEGMSLGADDYLVKPFSARELVARVDARIQLARQRREAERALRVSETKLAAELAERARAEAALRVNADTFYSLIENSPFGVYVVDADFRIVQASQQALETFDSVEHLVGTDLGVAQSTIWPEPFASKTIGYHRRALETGEPYVSYDTVEARADRDIVEAYDWSVERIVMPDGRFGVVCYFYDQTKREQLARVLRQSEERQAYLLKLSDVLRPLADPATIQLEAMRVLGERLGVTRSQFYLAEPDGEHLVSAGGYADGVAPVTQRLRMDDFGPYVKESFRAGRTLAVADVTLDPRVGPAELASYEAIDIRSFIGIPLVKDGRFVAGLGLDQATPRQWTEADLALAQETAERTWAAVERARAEETLRQSEEKYRTLFDSIDEGLALVEIIRDAAGRPVDVLFLDVNSVFERQTGLANVIGRLRSEVGAPTETVWLEALDGVARSGEPLRVERHHQEFARWYRIYVARIGDVGSRQLAIVFEDITDRKERERNQALLTEITAELVGLEQVPQAMERLGERIAQHFGAARCLFVELAEELDSTLQIDGWSSPEALPLRGPYRLRDCISAAQMAMHLRGEPSIATDAQNDPRFNGQSYEALGIRSFVIVPLVRDQVCRFLLAVIDGKTRSWRDDEVELIRELTQRIWSRLERARAEEALRESAVRLREADQRKNDFLAMLGHELRNPLAAIRNGVALLRSEKARPESRTAALPIVAEQVAHMERLVDDLLDLTRIVQGRMQMRQEPMALQDALRQALEMVRSQPDAEGFTIDVRVPDAPLEVLGDRVRLAQVFMNILGNAVKYSGGSTRIEVLAMREGGSAVVRIRDYGIGIAPELLPRIFDPFVQAAPGLTLQSGLGLGLAVVRQLMRLHGGEVEAFSDSGRQGSEFVLHLPLALSSL